MVYLIRQQLFELKPTAQAIGNQHFRIQIHNFVHQFVPKMNRRIVKFPFEAHTEIDKYRNPHTRLPLFWLSFPVQISPS
jgi:hypothetical protein